mmetsp:Transcript_22673/g.54562  ORF Transcript_22673/g.54562 Transcript_22673/m.54562 type:complete len:215 (+) Transcript_22673:3713-4357(+)
MRRDHCECEPIRSPAQRRSNSALVALWIIECQEVKREQLERVDTPEQSHTVVVCIGAGLEPEFAAVGASLGRERHTHFFQVPHVTLVIVRRIGPIVHWAVGLAMDRAFVAEARQFTLCFGHVVELLERDHMRPGHIDELEHARPSTRPVDHRGVVGLGALGSVSPHTQHVANLKPIVREPVRQHVPLEHTERRLIRDRPNLGRAKRGQQVRRDA